MELFIKLITVTGLGIIELWAAIPMGTALKLHPLINGIASALGAIIGAVLVIVLGDRLRNWLLKGKGAGEKRPNLQNLGKVRGDWTWNVVSPANWRATWRHNRNFTWSITRTAYILDEYWYCNLDYCLDNNQYIGICGVSGTEKINAITEC